MPAPGLCTFPSAVPEGGVAAAPQGWAAALRDWVGKGAGRWVLRRGAFNRLSSLLSALGLWQPAVLGTAGLGCGDGSRASRVPGARR